MATPAELIEKYEKLRDQEGVRVVRGLYDLVIDDLKEVKTETELERARRLLKVEVDALERLFEMDDPEAECKRCGLPCQPGAPSGRSGAHAAGGGVICEECL